VHGRPYSLNLTILLAWRPGFRAGCNVGDILAALGVLIAEILDGMTVGRSRRGIHELLDLLPQTAGVRSPGGGCRPKPFGSAGWQCGVGPAGRIPVDGVVASGHSSVDQSTITGESMPVEKISGTQVFAGTFNQSGLLEIRAERIGRGTAFGQIIEAAERAGRSRAPIQRTADCLAGYLVYFALGCAALTFLITRDPRSTISVIVVAGAGGIAAGTPFAILGAIGGAARNGAIIKVGLYCNRPGFSPS
jgi:Cu+-exporting ATPase